MNRDRRNVQLAAERALVQSLNVLESMLKTVAAQVNLVLRHRVKHEGIVRVGGVPQRKNGRCRRHGRTLTALTGNGKMVGRDSVEPSRFIIMRFGSTESRPTSCCCLRLRGRTDNLTRMAKSGLGKGLSALISTRP